MNTLMHVLLGLFLASSVSALSDFIGASLYIAEWHDVNLTLKGDWAASTSVAQKEIIAGADWFNAQGPWSVVNKTLLPPSGDIHDYYSFPPYWWPDCSNVHNTTELSSQQIQTQCVYVRRDGQFNPDRTLVNDTGEFATLSAAVYFDILAWRITGNDQYAEKAASFIDTWFLNNATAMNPNLLYSQVIRGVNGSKTGVSEGILDLHCMTKIVSGILVMREAKAVAWTPERDAAMNAWANQYLQWLATNPAALGEKAASNNHGSFYFAQFAAIQVLVGDYAGATDSLHQYFNGIYQKQIVKSGEQPFEAVRTLPFHYRAYNAGAIIVICRIANYLGWDGWDIPTAEGATVKDAVDFSMALNQTDPGEGYSELFPDVAAVASHYDDPTGNYAAWLAKHDVVYPGEAWFFWEQPLSDSGIKVALDSGGSIFVTNGTSTSHNFGSTTGASAASGASQIVLRTAMVFLATLMIVSCF